MSDIETDSPIVAIIRNAIADLDTAAENHVLIDQLMREYDEKRMKLVGQPVWNTTRLGELARKYGPLVTMLTGAGGIGAAGSIGLSPDGTLSQILSTIGSVLGIGGNS